MLSKRHRFHGYGSLKYTIKNGRKVRDKYLGLRVAPNSRRKYSRVAVIVSRKIHKSAVKRNRIRRRIFEIVRHELPDHGSVNDIIITVLSPEAIDIPPPELYASVRQLFNELDLYEDS